MAPTHSLAYGRSLEIYLSHHFGRIGKSMAAAPDLFAISRCWMKASRIWLLPFLADAGLAI